MKKIHLLLLFLAIASAVHAQDNLIGKKKTTIDSATSAGQGKQFITGVATDTQLPYIGYKFADGKIGMYYFDKDDVCYQCAMLISMKNSTRLLTS